MADPQQRMTKGDRGELLSLIRKREKVMKAQAEKRAADLLAEFDAQSATIHHFDDDKVWAEAEAEARRAVEEANIKIAERCAKLGIPKEFAPGLVFGWNGRGHNAVNSRRQELRRAAQSKIKAMTAEAVAEIERIALVAQTDVLAQGLETESAKLFLNSLSAITNLMPPVQIGDMQALIASKKRESPYGYLDYDNGGVN